MSGVSRREDRDPTRWRVALVFALVAATYAAARAWHEPHWPTDFDQLWFAARTLASGGDPYAVVGPTAPFRWDWPLYYPLPAVLFALPFAVFPAVVARVLFSTLAAGVMGWAIGARVRALWPLVLSGAFLIAVSRAQWSPLLLAASWLPWLGAVTMAKPNVGLASLTALPRRGQTVAVSGMAAIGLVSLLVRPGWFAAWREATSVSPHIVAPLLLPGGFLLALAAVRWRRPEARLFLALACLPHTPSLYDLLLLFYACRTTRESLVLALLTHALFWGVVLFASYDTFDLYALALGKAAIFVVYLPVLMMILRRPNVSPPDTVAETIAASSAESLGWRVIIPVNRIDAALALCLGVACAASVWFPLNSYR